jgi:hypothetical protein
VLLDDHGKEVVIDGTCSTHEIDKIFVENFSRKTVKNRKLRKPGHRKQRKLLAGLIWLGIGSIDGFFE